MVAAEKLQSKTHQIMPGKQRKIKLEKKKKTDKKARERKREKDEGSDSTECRAGSCQSGLLQQECSTGYRMEGGRRAGGKMMKLCIRGETEAY